MNETILNYGALSCPADWRNEGPPPKGVMARLGEQPQLYAKGNDALRYHRDAIRFSYRSGSFFR